MENLAQSQRQQRRPKGIINPITINILHQSSPIVNACWSAALPGFGHLLLGSHVKGFLLIIWEIIINTNAKINLAILYSFTGRYEQAKSIIDKRWAFLYITVFIFAVWDSYRRTVDINRFSKLADLEKSPVIPLKVNSLEINYLDKRNPWMAIWLSVLMPGVGHLYVHRLVTGFFVLIWWISVSYFSHLYESLYYTAIGLFDQAIKVVDFEWFLFVPSISGFSIYHSYVSAIEYNKMFEIEQSRFLRENYLSSNLERFSKVTKTILGRVKK